MLEFAFQVFLVFIPFWILSQPIEVIEEFEDKFYGLIAKVKKTKE